ncbi:DUF1553 domain-containing protein [Neolewinella aurantiaca]|uniref:DUF1553 domain-containing protein n=1 Tax=Neolewinella aurantiaca TaxID=2602767 RepID=A0A5C7FT46_9BACT|nr:DUF1553 domain-containing protein [Neolewinella aurantiaca]TXF87921.1 DUF1553 domain-containing protein [Neolewinella aurantiaca]
MKSYLLYGLLVMTVLALCSGCGPNLPEGVEEAYAALPKRLDYNIHVKPVLSDKCFLCHGPDAARRAADLRLDVPGFVDGDEILARIFSDDPDFVMPEAAAKIPLSDHEKAVIAKWIEQGADYADHWAFIPPERPEPPTVAEAEWNDHPIDKFIRRKQQARGFGFAPEADRDLLLRRLSFDLTGLPPTPAEIAAFESDRSADAYEKQVDRLLASPAYGERMATQWMDLARFADTHGYTVDRYRDMSPWRDWVIEKFNENQPYDEFVTWQLAGDLLPNATREQILATGFNRLHPQNLEGGIIEEEFRSAYVADRADVLGTGLLGLTLSCAKCHDHKFDPISQRNYYEFYSFFNNVDEAGLIPWDGATPPPRLDLPTERQDSIITFLREMEKKQEAGLVAVTEENKARAEEWINQEGYKKLPRTASLRAHYPLDNNRLINAARPAEKGKMDRKFSQSESPEMTKGHSGNGLLLDGDAWLDLYPVGVYSRDEAFSIEMWTKIPKDLKTGFLFHKGQGTRLHGERGYHLYLDTFGLELLMAHVNPGNSIVEFAETDVPRDEWIHLAVTYDGSSKASGYRLYMNGKELPTDVRTDDLTRDIIFHNMTDVIYKDVIEPGLQIGARWRGKGVKGTVVDEIKVYSRALSALEVMRSGNPEEARRLLAKGAAELSSSEKDLLRQYYFMVTLPAYQIAYKDLMATRSRLVDSMEQVKEIMVMREMKTPRQSHILDRGLYDSPTEPVETRTPDWLAPMPEGAPANRLGLAQWLFQPEHPLTARVAVNRYWLQLFGRGLVRTAEDFGNQGELPTHPELLDWLATEYISNGWDTKALLKTIVMSRTYRMSSKPVSEEQRLADVDNVWLARGPSGRLGAEMIRDNALAASGLLNDKIGGKSVKPYQPEGLWKMNNAVYEQDEGDELYRRSLYVFWKRTVPHPTLATFDVPNRNECTVRRQETNTPLQALVLMNDPAFVEAARILGSRITKAQNRDEAIREVFTYLSGRPPGEEEINLLRQLRKQEVDVFSDHPAKADGWLSAGYTRADPTLDPIEVAADAVLASVIINSDAVITKR